MHSSGIPEQPRPQRKLKALFDGSLLMNAQHCGSTAGCRHAVRRVAVANAYQSSLDLNAKAYGETRCKRSTVVASRRLASA
jgi:hypothetical protein